MPFPVYEGYEEGRGGPARLSFIACKWQTTDVHPSLITLAEGNGVGQQLVPEKRMATFEVEKNRVAAFCRSHRIRRLALFGSVLRDDFGPDSDIDVLVEFEEGCVPGLAFFAMEQELSKIFGRKVDLNTPQFLSRYFRDTVLAEAEDQYAA